MTREETEALILCLSGHTGIWLTNYFSLVTELVPQTRAAWFLYPRECQELEEIRRAAVTTFMVLQDVSDLIKINKTINFQFKFYLEEGDTVRHQKHATLPYDQTLPAGSTWKAWRVGSAPTGNGRNGREGNVLVSTSLEHILRVSGGSQWADKIRRRKGRWFLKNGKDVGRSKEKRTLWGGERMKEGRSTHAVQHKRKRTEEERGCTESQ